MMEHSTLIVIGNLCNRDNLMTNVASSRSG